VFLSDAPVQGVSEIWVEFDGITLTGDGAPIDIAFDAPISVDLLTLTIDNTEQLLDAAPVPAGTYSQLRLHVNAEHDGVMDSYVMTSAGGQEEIRVPSGAQTGLKLNNGITITADRETSLFIDWDARMGLVVDPPGLPGVLLRPTLRVIDMTEFGTLNGTVAMALVTDADCTNDLNVDSGNAVYVYDAFDFAAEDPDDLGGTGPVPIATAAVTQDTNGDYVYETILSPGDYTVAFTCQADDDASDTDEDIDFGQPTDVTIVDGGTATVDF
jgi:hypothetical protein